jgi:hypothetical protein
MYPVPDPVIPPTASLLPQGRTGDLDAPSLSPYYLAAYMKTRLAGPPPPVAEWNRRDRRRYDAWVRHTYFSVSGRKTRNIIKRRMDGA